MKTADDEAERGASRRLETSPRHSRPSLLILAIAGLAAAAGFAAAALVSPADAYQPTDLAGVEARVRSEHSDIEHLRPEEFARMRAAVEPLIVDVRDAEEFAVSRLPGAMHVDPDIDAEAFVASIGAKAKGRPVVFYCSVGVRSSRLASRAKAGLRALGADGVYNLEGGLFRWHNESRTLVDAAGPTERIHPYNAYWGGLIARRQSLSSTPR